MPSTTDAVEGMEDSNAKEALQAEPEAAGAYDKIPFASASAIFTMDTSNDIFLVHSIQACVYLYTRILPDVQSNWK